MHHKILVVGLGGTIGSTRANTIALSDNTLKILDYCKYDNVEFSSATPFSILSENITREHWQSLIDYLDGVCFDEYKGVVILHGSDTLCYTGAIIGNAFPEENIVLVASNKPVEDEDSNAIANFDNAIKHIINNDKGVFVSYNGITRATDITSADINDEFRSINSSTTPCGKKKISNKNVLIVKAYATMDFGCYDLSKVDAVLIEMYHSATVPRQAIEFSSSAGVPVYFVTHQASAEYETAKDISNILFSTTIENAFAQAILE